MHVCVASACQMDKGGGGDGGGGGERAKRESL